MTKKQSTLPSFNVIIERFGIFYLYDGNQVESFSQHADFKRFIFSENLELVASLDIALQELNIPSALEVLELFSFVYPTVKIAPSVKSIAKFLKLKEPTTPEQEVIIIYKIIESLYQKIDSKDELYINVFSYMLVRKWGWAKLLNNLFKLDFNKLNSIHSPEQKFLNSHKDLKKWQYTFFNDEYDLIRPITEENTEKTLTNIITKKGGSIREQQLEYSKILSKNFNIDISNEQVNVALLQAPTGIGKTYGYLAPSLLFAKQNKVPVWISTFTKNLQQQVLESLSEFDDIKVALRKGKQNYLCLLKAMQTFDKQKQYFSGFIALWIAKTSDGDIISGDFPQWLFNLHNKRATDYVDNDHSCIYSACPHFKKCFIEKSIQNANSADIIVSNHALTAIEGVVNFNEPTRLPPVVVFDESHDLFTAVDDAFSSFLSARELKDFTDFLGLRNKKGLMQRLAETLQYLPDDAKIGDNMNKIVELGSNMPYNDWFTRLAATFSVENKDERLEKLTNEKNISQQFFNLLYETILKQNLDNQYSNMQTDIKHLFEQQGTKSNELILISQARAMRELLAEIGKNLNIIIDRIDILLEQYFTDSEHAEMRTEQKLRGLQNSIKVKMQYTLDNWILSLTQEENKQLTTFLELNMASDGRIFDLGVKTHFTNPMKPFASKVLRHLESVNLTSATMNDRPIKEDKDWKTALELTGVDYLQNKKLTLHQAKTPFDYKKQATVLIIDDVDYHNKLDLARAYSELFNANKGSSLGLFTAISRLQGVYNVLRKALKENSINLYAQHMQNMNVSTLVDIFKEDVSSCLIGTDALKQGVDVPGESLSLVVCDKLPRPVPTILMEAREKAFGKQYRNMVTRMSLKQAFGRLIRTVNDKGVFVLFDPRINRSEIQAFPEEVNVQTVSLKQAIEIIKNQEK